MSAALRLSAQADTLSQPRTRLESQDLATTFIPDEHGGRLVCAAASSPTGLHGNSFWIAQRDGTLYLGTWTPVIYEITDPDSLVTLCRESIERSTTAIYRLPEDIIRKHALIEWSANKFDNLWS